MVDYFGAGNGDIEVRRSSYTNNPRLIGSPKEVPSVSGGVQEAGHCLALRLGPLPYHIWIYELI
jgi:hypothetical protein